MDRVCLVTLRGAATVAANGGLPTEGFKVVISKAVNFDCLAEKKEHLEKEHGMY